MKIQYSQKNINKIRHILGWDEQAAAENKEKQTLMINELAKRIREEAILIDSGAENSSG